MHNRSDLQFRSWQAGFVKPLILVLLLPLFASINACSTSNAEPTETQRPTQQPSVPFPFNDRTVPLSSEVDRSSPGADLAFERISLDQGLSQSTVTAIVQDQYGFMWFGTADSLNRFDGYSFVTYRHNPGDSQSLSSNQITALLVDSQGMLWVGTRQGVNRYLLDQDAFISYQHREGDPNSISDDHVLILYEDGRETLWIGEEVTPDMFESIAVSALDESTLEISLEFPAGYFLSMTPLWTLSAVPQDVIEEYGEQWYEAGNIITSGRFVLSEWVHNVRRTLLRNPLMPEDMRGTGNVERLIANVVPDTSTGYALWLNGEVDFSGIPDAELQAHLE